MIRLKQMFTVVWSLALALSVNAQQAGYRAGTSSGTSNVDIALAFSLGGASYEENVNLTGAKSDWSAALFDFSGAVSIDVGTWVYQIHGSYLLSDEDTEEWTEGGTLVQKNNMDLDSLSILGEAGYPLMREEATRLTPFVGLGSRFITFDRSNFRILRRTARIENTDVGSVEESVDLFYLNGALALDQELNTDNHVATRLDLGYVFFNEVDNDLLSDSLEGDGGYIVRGELQWIHQHDPLNQWGVGVFVDFQDLNGDTVSSRGQTNSGLFIPFDVEWPDNELLSYGVSLFWKHDL